MFTRQHFQALADMVKANRQVAKNTGQEDMLNRIQEDLVSLFQQENPKFKKALFLKACGEEA